MTVRLSGTDAFSRECDIRITVIPAGDRFWLEVLGGPERSQLEASDWRNRPESVS